MECCICHRQIEQQIHPSTGEAYWTKGHNALPVKDGRCCDGCNQFVVFPARLKHFEFFINGWTNDDDFHTIKKEFINKLTDRRKDNEKSPNPSSH